MIQNIPQISICGPLGMGLLRWFVHYSFFINVYYSRYVMVRVIWTTKLNQILEQDLISNSQQIGIHLSTDFFCHLNSFQ